MHSREATVVNACLAYLRRLSYSRWEKRHGTAMGRVGQPDITGCYHGRRVEIEIKRPGQEPTERQHLELCLWDDAGAIVGWATSPQECREIILEWLDDNDMQVAP